MDTKDHIRRRLKDNDMTKKRIAIDFDGVLINGRGIPRKPDVAHGQPHKNAVAGVKYLQELGYECFILTSRASHEWPAIKEWMVKWGFPEIEITNTKKNAVAYIDDRAIRFTNWQDICRYFG